MARPERFELPTSWFVAMRSIQLSYGRSNFYPVAQRVVQRAGLGVNSLIIAKFIAPGLVCIRGPPHRGRASYHTDRVRKDVTGKQARLGTARGSSLARYEKQTYEAPWPIQLRAC